MSTSGEGDQLVGGADAASSTTAAAAAWSPAMAAAQESAAEPPPSSTSVSETRSSGVDTIAGAEGIPAADAATTASGSSSTLPSYQVVAGTTAPGNDGASVAVPAAATGAVSTAPDVAATTVVPVSNGTSGAPGNDDPCGTQGASTATTPSLIFTAGSCGSAVAGVVGSTEASAAADEPMTNAIQSQQAAVAPATTVPAVAETTPATAVAVTTGVSAGTNAVATGSETMPGGSAAAGGSSLPVTLGATATPGSSSGITASPPVPAPPMSKVEVKLFIGRLPRTIEESAITPLFTPYGEVLETVVIRDKSTGTHKGSAFIKMASLSEADVAVRALHGIKVMDAQLGPIQVKYANGEPERLGLSLDAAQAGTDMGKLFVGSLPKPAGEAEVRAIFEPYGRVEEAVVLKENATGISKGCAFVKFAFKEQALVAIKALHGVYTCNGCTRPLEVKFAENRRATAAAAAAAAAQQQQHQQHSIGYSPAVTHPHVVPGMWRGTPAAPAVHSNLNPRSGGGWTEYFTADGRGYYHNESIRLTQWSKPADFDRLCAQQAAAAAGRVAGVGTSDSAGPPGANVFVFHVPNEWTQQELLSHFSNFGHAISCYIATDRTTGRNKGYGFVSFDNVQSAVNAVIGMNGYPVGAKRLKVSIKSGEEPYAQHLFAAAGYQPQSANASVMSANAAGTTQSAGAAGGYVAMTHGSTGYGADRLTGTASAVSHHHPQFLPQAGGVGFSGAVAATSAGTLSGYRTTPY